MKWDEFLADPTLVGRRIQYVDTSVTCRARIAAVRCDAGIVSLHLTEHERLYMHRWKDGPDRILSFPLPGDEPRETDGERVDFTYKRTNRAAVFLKNHVFEDEKKAWESHFEGKRFTIDGAPADPKPSAKR